MSEKQYVIRWRSKITGYEGGNTTLFTKADAQEQADRANKDWPEHEHWIERRIKK